MYKIIRCGADYELIIAVTPHDAGVATKGARYYRYAAWNIGAQKPNVFNEVDSKTAADYFGGHADSVGFENLPEETFETLEAVLEFVTKERNARARKRLAIAH
jgi:hypothetical protein